MKTLIITSLIILSLISLISASSISDSNLQINNTLINNSGQYYNTGSGYQGVSSGTADVVVCRGTSSIDDAYKSIKWLSGCDVVCKSTDNDCGNDFNTAITNSNGSVFIKSGNYPITTTIQVNKAVNLNGNNRNAKLIINTPVGLNVTSGFTRLNNFAILSNESDAIGINYYAWTGNSLVNPSIRDMDIETNGQYNGLIGISLTGSGTGEITAMEIQNTEIYGYNTSLYNTLPSKITAINTVFEYGITGINNTGSTITLVGGWFESLTNGIIAIHSSNNNVIDAQVNSVTTFSTLIPGLGYTPYITRQDARGYSPNPNGVSSDSLQIYYNGNNNVKDYSGNGNTGSLINSPTFTLGRFGNAYTFDGTNKHIMNGTVINLTLSSGYTVSSWVLFNDTNNRPIFSLYENPYDSYLTTNATGYLGETYLGTWYPTGSIIYPNQWYHIVLSCPSDSSNGQVYLNGILELGTIICGKTQYTAKLYVGRVSTSYLNGSIDNFMLWNRSMNGYEVKSLYDLNSEFVSMDAYNLKA